MLCIGCGEEEDEPRAVSHNPWQKIENHAETIPFHFLCGGLVNPTVEGSTTAYLTEGGARQEQRTNRDDDDYLLIYKRFH